MLRRLFTLVSAISLMMFVGVVALWVRSHLGSGDRRMDLWSRLDGGRYERREWLASSRRGQLRAERL